PSRAEIEKYYGRYGGCEVFLSRYSGGEEAEDYWYVAGYEFYFPCLGYSIYVHKDGNIWELDKAYEEGIIAEEDVKKIAEKHGGAPAEKTEPDNVGVTSMEWRETERVRRKELCDFRREFVEFIGKTNSQYAELDPADVRLQLYGEADGWEIFLPLYKMNITGYPTMYEYITIGGYEFYFPCLGYELYVAGDGEFYELENAYEMGYVGEDVAAAAAENNHAKYFYAFE
ncbi:MAG: hypothetical protein NC253_13505, partial [Ruminococcus sp.]|nr:hypothetical protein [Ruminococcus sp.]